MLSLLSHSSQISVTFQDGAINAGDIPLMSVVNHNSTLMTVEATESIKGSAPFVSEVQRITIETNATSRPLESFYLGDEHYRSRSLSTGISAAELAGAIEELPRVRGTVEVQRSLGALLSWTITFLSPGPATLLTSPCEAGLNGKKSPNCQLAESSIKIERVVRGSSPASGTFRLMLAPTEGKAGSTNQAHTGTTTPLFADVTAATMQAALMKLAGGQNAKVIMAPSARAEYGYEWSINLGDEGASSVEVVDVHIEGPSPWCTDGIMGPAPAETPCEFPFSSDREGNGTLFACAGSFGSNPGWCSTAPALISTRGRGSCSRCASHALEPPKMYVSLPRRAFFLRGMTSQVLRSLSEVVYHPRAFWNAWLGGLDEVSAHLIDDRSFNRDDRLSGAKARAVCQVSVTPVNDPPAVSIGRETRMAYEGQEVLLDDAVISDDDLIQRPQVNIRVELEARLGTLTVGDLTGLTFLSGSPTPHSASQLLFTGSLATIQTAIHSIRYRPLHGLAAGAATMRESPEVQRVELVAPFVPMVQAITMSAIRGYIEGSFALSINCSTFLDAVDKFPPYVDMMNYTTDSVVPLVFSTPFMADAPATGNGSIEVGVRAMLARCVDIAAERARLIEIRLNTSLQELPSTGSFTVDALPYRAATAVVSRGEPDYHGSLTWAVTLMNVPHAFPAFQVSANNLTSAGTGYREWPHVYSVGSSSSETPSLSIAVVRATSSLSGPSGSFTLAARPGGESTDPISTMTSAADVAVALGSLSEIGAIQVSTGSVRTSREAAPVIGRYWEVTFLQAGTPIQVGDLQPLEAKGIGLEAEGAAVHVSEVSKGRALTDSVTIVVDDLGNFGEGGPLQATAAWNITIVSEYTAPVVYVERPIDPKEFLRVPEGTVLQLAAIKVSHAVAWETAAKTRERLEYLVRLTCARGAVKPSTSAIGRGMAVTLPSSAITELSGTLPAVNLALSSLNYFSPRRFRGVDDIRIAVRLAGTGFEGGWGNAKLHVFVNGTTRAPEISAPRLLKMTGTLPVVVGGISVMDDTVIGILTVSIGAARGRVSFRAPHRLQPLDAFEVLQLRGLR